MGMYHGEVIYLSIHPYISLSLSPSLSIYVCMYIYKYKYTYISYTHIHDMTLITGLVIYLYISSKKAYIRV